MHCWTTPEGWKVSISRFSDGPYHPKWELERPDGRTIGIFPTLDCIYYYLLAREYDRDEIETTWEKE